jgi:hypothetical protein
MAKRGWEVASGLVGLVLIAVGAAGAQKVERREAEPEPPSIAATQLGMRLGRKQYQGTVIAKRDHTLTVITAAHCMAPEDVGHSILLHQNNAVIEGRVQSVVQNPDYRPILSREPGNESVRGTLAVDSAVAAIEVRPQGHQDDTLLRKIRAATLADHMIPSGTREVVVVHILDQKGREHVVRAGNHLNPKCLAWGSRNYRPEPGDSGAGVFLVRRGADGRLFPLLIGHVALLDGRGGIAPLVSHRSRWIEASLSLQSSGGPAEEVRR